MTEVQKLATFSSSRKFSDLSKEAIRELKIRVLDSIGCAIGALEGAPVRRIKDQIEDFGGNPLATMIGGNKTAPDRASFYNSALIRYLDYNDSYLAKGETCHPSDTIGSILAAGQYADISGKQFLTAVAIAYQVQCRLSDVAPVRHKGFDHTVQGAYGTAAGVSYALGLSPEKTANAIAIAGTAYNALRVTRTGNLSNWKGLAFPSTAWTATHAAFLAMRGITGPEEVFEGNKGFKDSIAGDFSIDWSAEDLERVRKTIIKKYNAEIHSQSTLEGVIELRNKYAFNPDDIASITLHTFDVAYHIIGGGEEGSKKNIRTKEEADHSLPYMIAAAILDGNVLPPQYKPERILKEDIQTLLKKVQVFEKKEYSDKFPDQEACDVTIIFKDGKTLHIDKVDYEGFHTRPASWDFICEKFNNLSKDFTDQELRNKIITVVQNLEDHSINDLMNLLSQVIPVAI
ncbi:MmgE/PrpD family protein [Aquimarina sp. TRL1]|uniref:MmgE/PrpD family protein n=1 Tax=Aquimarina sp. (strain TRL1) TaxID=2736252 RepID=UPI0015887BAF|nr:MmgE/PrpD family protein [Aquimarina sp. TRL1]QKX06626.1 MmgE/PrpD family protein [Aquimarina sp. TRL1]